MKVWPFGAAPAGGGFKPPCAALAEDRCRERYGKGARDASGGDREDDRCGNIEMVPDDVETGALDLAPGQARRVPAGWPGGVRCRGGVSPVCGSRAERGKACPDTAASARGDRESLGRGVRSGASEYRRGTRRRTGS